MTRLETSAHRVVRLPVPAPSFLQVVSLVAMAAPLLIVLIAQAIGVDALDRADLVVSSLEGTAVALGVALLLRGLLQIVTPHLPAAAIDSDLTHDGITQ